MRQRKWLPALLVAALAFCALAVPVAAIGADYENSHLGHDVNVPLVTQDGKDVRYYDDLIKGKIVAVNFIYTGCGFTCPLETARLAQVQEILGDRVGKDIFFYSISIDPVHDTPDVLRAYMKKYGVKPGWTFLTGKAEDIDRLATKLGLTGDPNITAGPGKEVDGHAPHLLIGNDTTGQWLRDASTDNPRLLAHLLTSFVSAAGDEPPAAAMRRAASAAPLRFTPGQYLFAKDCAGCHTIGRGEKLGPDLQDATRIHDRAWLMRYIQEPNKMREAGDPTALALAEAFKVTMPNLGLGDGDVAALIDFLDSVAPKDGPPR
jgi:protein SCO1